MKTCSGLPAAVLAGWVVVQAPNSTPAHAQSLDLGSIIGMIQGAAQAEADSRQAQRRAPSFRTTAVDPIRDSRAYVIDGHGLGDRLGRVSSDFNCKPSEQFPGHTWCRSRRPVQGITTATSILLSGGGEIRYYNKFYESAHFLPDAIAAEVKRLSGLYHQAPRILRMPRGADSDGIIAVWGDMELKSVDQSTMQHLMAGESVVSGIMVDFLGNLRDSARSALPVFRVAGGAGYYWAARFDASGLGNLRFGMANASLYDDGSSSPPPDSMNTAEGAPSAAASQQAADAAQASAVAQQAAAEQARIAKQQEDARQAKLAEEKAAREAVVARLRADRVANAVAAARRQLDDAATFVRANRDDPELMTHLQHIADVTAAMNASDPAPDTIEQKSAALSADLSADAAYTAYAAKRDADRKRERERDLADTATDLRLKKAFLIDALARDPTGPMAGDLLTLAKQIDAAVSAADVERSQTLIGTIDAAIGKAGLSDSLKLARQNAAQVVSAGTGHEPIPTAAAPPSDAAATVVRSP